MLAYSLIRLFAYSLIRLFAYLLIRLFAYSLIAFGLLTTPVVANPTAYVLIEMAAAEPVVAFNRTVTLVFVIY
ncbi:hypothetical protein A165_03245 [Vibrio tasmaniensis ZS-17]|nr:hypothetical protein A165_03245 [Vibrio tasmaniensis ZS-17]